MRFKSDSQRRAVFRNIFSKDARKFHIDKDYKSSAKIEGKMGGFEDVWRAETELPTFDTTLDNPTNKYREHDIALTEMSPDDFIRAQYEQYRVHHYGHEYPVSYEEWLYPDDVKVDYFRQILRGEKHKPIKNIYGPESKLPVTILEYDEEGNLTGFQEGKHRALAAKAEGLNAIPVLIAKKHIREEDNKFSDINDLEFYKKRNRDNYAMVDVDMDKFDANWKKDPEYYVGLEGEGGMRDRYETVKGFIEGTNEPIEAPEVTRVKSSDIVSFTDGRHRAAVLRDLGAKRMTLLVPDRDKQWFEENFGV